MLRRSAGSSQPRCAFSSLTSYETPLRGVSGWHHLWGLTSCLGRGAAPDQRAVSQVAHPLLPRGGRGRSFGPGLLAVTLPRSVPRSGAASGLLLARGPCCKDPLSGPASACSKSPRRAECLRPEPSPSPSRALRLHAQPWQSYIGGSCFCSLPRIDPTKGFPVCLGGGVTLSRVPLSTSPCSSSVSDQLDQTFSPRFMPKMLRHLSRSANTSDNS